MLPPAVKDGIRLESVKLIDKKTARKRGVGNTVGVLLGRTRLMRMSVHSSCGSPSHSIVARESSVSCKAKLSTYFNQRALKLRSRERSGCGQSVCEQSLPSSGLFSKKHSLMCQVTRIEDLAAAHQHESSISPPAALVCIPTTADSLQKAIQASSKTPLALGVAKSPYYRALGNSMLKCRKSRKSKRQEQTL